MTPFISLWLKAFALTLAMEVPVYSLAARWWDRSAPKIPLLRLILAAAACTGLTHPLLWFVWRDLIPDYTVAVMTGETLVVALEALVFFALARPISLLGAAVASLAANMVSYGLGEALYALGLL